MLSLLYFLFSALFLAAAASVVSDGFLEISINNNKFVIDYREAEFAMPLFFLQNQNRVFRLEILSEADRLCNNQRKPALGGGEECDGFVVLRGGGCTFEEKALNSISDGDASSSPRILIIVNTDDNVIPCLGKSLVSPSLYTILIGNNGERGINKQQGNMISVSIKSKYSEDEQQHPMLECIRRFDRIYRLGYYVLLREFSSACFINTSTENLISYANPKLIITKAMQITRIMWKFELRTEALILAAWIDVQLNNTKNIFNLEESTLLHLDLSSFFMDSGDWSVAGNILSRATLQCAHTGAWGRDKMTAVTDRVSRFSLLESMSHRRMYEVARCKDVCAQLAILQFSSVSSQSHPFKLLSTHCPFASLKGVTAFANSAESETKTIGSWEASPSLTHWLPAKELSGLMTRHGLSLVSSYLRSFHIMSGKESKEDVMIHDVENIYYNLNESMSRFFELASVTTKIDHQKEVTDTSVFFIRQMASFDLLYREQRQVNQVSQFIFGDIEQQQNLVSSFILDLIKTHNILSVYWDERGSFISSQRHGMQAMELMKYVRIREEQKHRSDWEQEPSYIEFEKVISTLPLLCSFSRPILSTPTVQTDVKGGLQHLKNQHFWISKINKHISLAVAAYKKSTSSFSSFGYSTNKDVLINWHENINRLKEKVSRETLSTMMAEGGATNTPPSMMIGYNNQVNLQEGQQSAQELELALLSLAHQSSAECWLVASNDASAAVTAEGTDQNNNSTLIRVGFLSTFFFGMLLFFYNNFFLILFFMFPYFQQI